MPPPWLLRLVLVLVLAILLPTFGKLVLYDNTSPMLDNQGRILDAHDGTIQRFHDDGPYYMHAVEYGLCQVRALGVWEPGATSEKRQGQGLPSHRPT